MWLAHMFFIAFMKCWFLFKYPKQIQQPIIEYLVYIWIIHK